VWPTIAIPPCRRSPSTGSTVTACLIKDLIARGDLRRCLIVMPDSLVEQWQDKLAKKFSLDVNILSRESIEDAPGSNLLLDADCRIVRLDRLSPDYS
jgi:SNF2 family DNA or RNA helicase